MANLLEFLGFTTLESGLWNVLSYAAFAVIIAGVYSDKRRNFLITLGALPLAFYAELFLFNRLFAMLQVLILVSGVMQMLKFDKKTSVVILTLLTIAAYINLYSANAIPDIWAFAGSLGLLGIALGLITLPNTPGFLIMATGGALLIVYAYMVAAWVFFFLNLFFTYANIQTWRRQNKKPVG